MANNISVQWIDTTHEMYLEVAKKTNLVKPVDDLHSNVKDSIKNIIGDSSYQDMILVNTLLNITKHWGIHLTDTPVNKRPEENELKVLDCYKKNQEKTWNELDLHRKLELIWAKKVFEWVVDDTYFDYTEAKNKFPDLVTLKEKNVSLRVRSKLDTDWNYKMYYTLKKKKTKESEDEKSRICFETEFEISNHQLAIENLIWNWLNAYRRKFKLRESYILWNSNNTVDIDTYVDINWNPIILPFLEFEVEDTKDAYDLIQLFNLTWESNKILTCGSRWLFKHEWVDYDTMSNSKWIILPKKSKK